MINQFIHYHHIQTETSGLVFQRTLDNMKANNVYIRDVTVPILPMPVPNGISGCRNDTTPSTILQLGKSYKN
jgi:hypothetical protein